MDSLSSVPQSSTDVGNQLVIGASLHTIEINEKENKLKAFQTKISSFVKSLESGGRYYFRVEAAREIVEIGLSVFLVVSFCNIGVSKQYLILLALVVGMNVSITPVLFFQKPFPQHQMDVNF